MADANPSFTDLLEGDLGPARRHLARIERGQLPPSPAVLHEISASIERCIERLLTAAPVVTGAQPMVTHHGGNNPMTIYRDDDISSDLWPFPYRRSVALFLIALAAAVFAFAWWAL
jgi:hypothetical protein